MRTFAVCAGVIVLVAAGYMVGKIAMRSGPGPWNSETVYALWCVSAETAPSRMDGTQWDEDGSPPDLSAEISWRGNRVLRSPTSRNSLVATWDKSSLALSDLFRKEFRPGDLDKVARIKAEPSETITIDLYDRDIFASEHIGKVHVSVGRLRSGKNLIDVNETGAGLRSVSLQVAPAEILENGGKLPDELNVVTPDAVQFSHD